MDDRKDMVIGVKYVLAIDTKDGKQHRGICRSRLLEGLEGSEYTEHRGSDNAGAWYSFRFEGTDEQLVDTLALVAGEVIDKVINNGEVFCGDGALAVPVKEIDRISVMLV